MARDGKRSGVKYAENDEQVNTVFAKTEWAITDEHALEASVFNYHEKFSSSPWQSLFWSEDAQLPTSGRLKQRDYSLIYKYTPLNNRWINFSAQYYNAKALNHRIRTGFSRGNPVYIDYKNKDDRWGVRLKNESLFGIGVLEHRLVTGIDYEHRKENAIFWYNGELSDFGSFPNFYKDLGIYAQDVFSVGRFEFTLGGRFDKFKRGVKSGDMTHWFRPNNDNKYYVVRGQKYEYVDETFTIVNFKGRWEPKNFDSYLLNKGLKISFGVNNIFNKEYIYANGLKDTSRVGKGRNFYVDFEKTF
nr:MAG TPA: TonB-dependent heme/hemoglobin receptor family protein [Caudoviricetes sp.]